MKKFILPLIAVCCLAIMSCKKEKQITADDLFIAADLGTNTWLAAPTTGITAGDSLLIVGQNTLSTLTVKMAFNGKGTYNINAADATYAASPSPGAGLALYKLDGTKTNTVIFTQYVRYQILRRARSSCIL